MDENNRTTPEPREERREKRRKRILKEIREWIVSLVAALLVVTVLRMFVFTIIRVDGRSMQPTLMNGERLFVTVYDVKFGSAERGNVVICNYPNRGSDYFVKRVVGVPGDSVYREGGVTHVVYSVEVPEGGDADSLVPDPENSTVIVLGSGSVLVDQALDPETAISPYQFEPDYDAYVLGEDEYFVVGDNRYDSHDSRDWNDGDPSMDVGPISKKMIIGHVRSVFWPLNNFRTVE